HRRRRTRRPTEDTAMLTGPLLAGALSLLPGAADLPADAVARLGTVHLQHPGGATAVCFSPDGKRLVTAGRDGLLRAWDARTGKGALSRPGHAGLVSAARRVGG